MKQPQMFKEIVDESTQIRFDLNSNYHSKMNVLALVFEGLTGVERRTFYTIKDMEYYQGGYPSENSPPKIEALMDRFVLVYKWFKFLGKEKVIEKYFKARGINISADSSGIEDSEVTIDSLDSRTRMKFLQIVGSAKLPAKKKDFILLLLNHGCDLQGTICTMANKIKIDNFEVVKEKCEVSKPNFITSVQLSYRKLKNEVAAKGEIEEKDHEADDLKEALTIISD